MLAPLLPHVAQYRRVVLTLKKVAEQNEDVLDHVRMLSCRLEDTRLSLIADKQDAVSINISRHNLLSLFRLLCLIYSSDLRILLLSEGAGPDSTVPGNRSLTDVALERGQVRRRVEGHDYSVAAASSERDCLKYGPREVNLGGGVGRR